MNLFCFYIEFISHLSIFWDDLKHFVSSYFSYIFKWSISSSNYYALDTPAYGANVVASASSSAAKTVPFNGGGWKLITMSYKLLYVPMIKPAIPNNANNTFRMTTTLNGPKSFGYLTQISITAGNAMPSTDRHRAPNNEMNKPSRGTEMARKTGKKWFELVIQQFIRMNHR